MKRSVILGRRQFLATGTAALAGVATHGALAGVAPGSEFVAAYGNADGGFGYAIFGADGHIRLDRALPARAHGAAVDPGHRRMVMIARRPGKFALVIDPRDGATIRRIDAVDGRRFCGHGQFMPDGTLLMTENDYDAGHGVIGIYDYGKGYARTGEIATGGIGPHEMLLAGDGRTGIVANGGIETHPDYGRLKLNLATMQPNVALVDIVGERPTRTFRAPEALHQLSLRHMAVDADGAVWIGGQYEGTPTETPPLLTRFHPDQRDGDLQLFGQVSGLRNYVGSVAVSGDGGEVAITAPKAGRAMRLDIHTGRIIDTRSLAGVCGIAGCGQGFVVTGGGEIAGFESPVPAGHVDGRQWDNHLLRLPA